MTAVFYIADKIDKGLEQDDLDGFSLVATNNRTSKRRFQTTEFKKLNQDDQDRIHESYEIAENILKLLVRPRIYSSRSICTASVALLSIAPIILQMANQTVAGVSDFFLSLNNLKMKRFLEYVVSNSSSFDTIDKPRSPPETIEYGMNDIHKNMFLNYTNATFNNIGEIPLFPDVKKLVVGEFINRGNFGQVHEILSIEPGQGFNVPSIPLVVKIFPVYRMLTANKTFTDMDMDLRHNQSTIVESNEALDIYSKTFTNFHMLFILMEKVFPPDFNNEPTRIIIDVLKDTIRMNELGFVHGDIKPDNVMRKSNGKHVNVDGGSVSKNGSTYVAKGTPIYSAQEMNKPLITTFFGAENRVTILDDFVPICFTYMEIFAPRLYDDYESEYSPNVDIRELKIKHLQMFSESLKLSSGGSFNYTMGNLIQEYIKLESTLGEEQKGLDNINAFVGILKDSVN